MHLSTNESKGASALPLGPEAEARRRPVFALVTLIPLLWLLAVTMSAGWEKIFYNETRPGVPRVGVPANGAGIGREIADADGGGGNGEVNG